MKRHCALALLGLFTAIGCSSVGVTGDGIVSLQVLVPKTLAFAPTDSLVLQARALDINGDSIAAAIRWYTVDTLVISVDSIQGIVRAVATTGTGRVQAGVGTLRSDDITVTVKAPSP